MEITVLNAREIWKSTSENRLLSSGRIQVSEGDIHKKITNDTIFLIRESRR